MACHVTGHVTKFRSTNGSSNPWKLNRPRSAVEAQRGADGPAAAPVFGGVPSAAPLQTFWLGWRGADPPHLAPRQAPIPTALSAQDSSPATLAEVDGLKVGELKLQLLVHGQSQEGNRWAA